MSQVKCYEQFVGEFREDAEMLSREPDFSEKEKELEKVRKLELAKLEKLLKKDINECEELFAGNVTKTAKGLNALAEKLAKLMDGSLRKTLKKGLQSEEYRLIYQANLDLSLASLQKNQKATKTLEFLC